MLYIEERHFRNKGAVLEKQRLQFNYPVTVNDLQYQSGISHSRHVQQCHHFFHIQKNLTWNDFCCSP